MFPQKWSEYFPPEKLLKALGNTLNSLVNLTASRLRKDPCESESRE